MVSAAAASCMLWLRKTLIRQAASSSVFWRGFLFCWKSWSLMRCSQVAKYLQSNPTCHSVPCRVRIQWKKRRRSPPKSYFGFFCWCCVKRSCLVYFWLMPRKQVMYGFLNCTVLIFKGRDDNFLDSSDDERAFSPFLTLFCSTTTTTKTLYTLSEYRLENGCHFGRTLSEKNEVSRKRGE